MKTLYIDCGMGAAGDMLTAALLELHPDPDAFVEKLNGLQIPGVIFEKENSVKCGISGTHMHVWVNGEEEGDHDHEHHHDEHEHHHNHEHHHDIGEEVHGHDEVHDHHDHAHHDYHGDGHDHDHGHHHHVHRGMGEIEAIVRGLTIPEKVKEDVMAVYRLIAEAESHAHQKPVTEVHFHEVGTMDAIADITAVCLLMDELRAERIVVSPIHVGSGHVRCAHGILPVPAPATAYILQNCPIYGGKIQGELCTPTGAALLKHFASEFGEMPLMRVERTGYGMGKKDFEMVNCVRVMMGDTERKSEQVCELSCNLDDMTAEEIGFAMDRLFELHALDVYTVAAGMKKNRPGHILYVICKVEDRTALVSGIFRYTTTLGVREQLMGRYTLEREMKEINTPYGTVRQKVSSGYGVTRAKYEYEDLSRIAREWGMTLDEVRKLTTN